MTDKKKITASQALTIGAQIAGKLEGSDLPLLEAQDAIRNPDFAGNLLALIANGGNLPWSFGTLETIQPVCEETVSAREFLKRARAKAKAEKRHIFGHFEYDFFRLKKNWHLLPEYSSGIHTIVFVGAQFDDGEGRCVRLLYRESGSVWGEGDYGPGFLFDDDYWVAVSPIGA